MHILSSTELSCPSSTRNRNRESFTRRNHLHDLGYLFRRALSSKNAFQFPLLFPIFFFRIRTKYSRLSFAYSIYVPFTFLRILARYSKLFSSNTYKIFKYPSSGPRRFFVSSVLFHEPTLISSPFVSRAPSEG